MQGAQTCGVRRTNRKAATIHPLRLVPKSFSLLKMGVLTPYLQTRNLLSNGTGVKHSAADGFDCRGILRTPMSGRAQLGPTI